MTAAKIDGDSNLDLLVGNAGGNNTVSLLHGNGDGTFQPAQPLSLVSPQPFGVAVGDFNGDGKNDIATANITTGTVDVLLNGSFASPVVTGDIVYSRGRISEYATRFFPVYNADDASPGRGAP